MTEPPWRRRGDSFILKKSFQINDQNYFLSRRKHKK